MVPTAWRPSSGEFGQQELVYAPWFQSQSILPHPWIEFMSPSMDPAPHVQRVFEALRFEELDNVQATHAMMAKDNEWRIRGQCLIAFRNLPHRDVKGPVDTANREFVILAHIQEDSFRMIVS